MKNRLFDYWPAIGRSKLEWPNGARVAVWIGLNVEHYLIERPGISLVPVSRGTVPDPANWGWRDYGPRVGIWRVAEVLDRIGIRASVLLNSDVCELYPEIVSEGTKRGWAWLAHGKNNSTLQTDMPVDEEREYLSGVVAAIAQHTGHQPRGWLGPALTETLDTPDLLAELGLTYVCDWSNDDQPYPLNVKSGRMISMPYSLEIGDIPLLFDHGQTGPQYLETLTDHFDVLYDEGEESGRVMAIGIHGFLVGQPHRIRYLERALEHIAGHSDVWLTTSDEIAEWYLANHYERAVEEIAARAVKASPP